MFVYFLVKWDGDRLVIDKGRVYLQECSNNFREVCDNYQIFQSGYRGGCIPFISGRYVAEAFGRYATISHSSSRFACPECGGNESLLVELVGNVLKIAGV